MRPRFAFPPHLDWQSQLTAHHADTTFILRVDALAPVPLVFDCLIDQLELDAANEHLSFAFGVPIRVDPKRHHQPVLFIA